MYVTVTIDAQLQQEGNTATLLTEETLIAVAGGVHSPATVQPASNKLLSARVSCAGHINNPPGAAAHWSPPRPMGAGLAGGGAVD